MKLDVLKVLFPLFPGGDDQPVLIFHLPQQISNKKKEKKVESLKVSTWLKLKRSQHELVEVCSELDSAGTGVSWNNTERAVAVGDESRS